MSALAPTLQAFFTERLMSQRGASAHTIASYRDTFRILLGFAERQTGKVPSQLQIEDLDAKLIGAFLEHLEDERGNTIRTRNARTALTLVPHQHDCCWNRRRHLRRHGDHGSVGQGG
jgi:site-specific recombinase XerC